MSFQDLLKDTLSTLWAHKRRTMLTMFGIAWGIISITVMVAAGEGLGKGIQANQETFRQRRDDRFFRAHQHAGGRHALRPRGALGRRWTTCRWPRNRRRANTSCRSWETACRCTACTTAEAFPPWARCRSSPRFAASPSAEGRFYNHEDNDEARNVAFLGSDTKKQLFSDHEAVGQKVWMNGTPYSVIGVMKSKEQNSSYDGMDTRKIFIPYNTMRRDFPNKPPAVEHTIDRLLVAPKSLETHPDCVKQIRRSLGRLHNFDPRDKEAAGIWDTVKNAEANRMIIVGMELFMGAVGIATLFLGGLGVMNVMLVSVRERTREIGVRMALGATRKSILRQFFMETVIVVALSGGTGLFVSYGFCALVNLLPDAAVFCGIAGQLEAGGLVGDPAWTDFDFVGPVSGESRGLGRSDRSAAI